MITYELHDIRRKCSMLKTTHVPTSQNGQTDYSSADAYFLGAILAANEPKYFDGKKIWLAPYRHNYGPLTTTVDIENHMSLIRNLIKRGNKKVLSKEALRKIDKNWFPGNKQGFAVICPYNSFENLDTDDIVHQVGPRLEQCDDMTIRCFLVGAFDGRATIDYDKEKNIIRFVALDCDNSEVKELLSRLLLRFGINANYNTSRTRLEGGKPRKNQLRIGPADVEKFIRQIGIICPSRFRQVEQIYSDLPLHKKQEDDVLLGLKTFSKDMQSQNGTTSPVAEDFQKIQKEHDEDNILLEEISDYFVNHLDETAKFEYSGKPKEKSTPKRRDGYTVYERNRQTALNALSRAQYKCELGIDHPLFIRKNSDQYYTEPHHLVPLRYSDRFSVSLDVEENIVSLCSNCHNQLHYGRDIRPLLESLYQQRKDLLKSVGIEITLEELFEMYDA